MGVGIPKIRGRVPGIFPIVQKKTKQKFFALKHFLEPIYKTLGGGGATDVMENCITFFFLNPSLSEMEAGGVTWIIILLFCFAEHYLAMNHQEEIDEASPGAPWGAGVVVAEGSAVGSCAGHWVWDLHLA